MLTSGESNSSIHKAAENGAHAAGPFYQHKLPCIQQNNTQLRKQGLSAIKHSTSGTKQLARHCSGSTTAAVQHFACWKFPALHVPTVHLGYTELSRC